MEIRTMHSFQVERNCVSSSSDFRPLQSVQSSFLVIRQQSSSSKGEWSLKDPRIPPSLTWRREIRVTKEKRMNRAQDALQGAITETRPVLNLNSPKVESGSCWVSEKGVLSLSKSCPHNEDPQVIEKLMTTEWKHAIKEYEG
ncbi:hypothetical protein H6P81_019555 [Aristolochia fimbriata]|uniref:Uncharacterized protein n=1 Tax=Aristolochia fimbriata TaxID=158543 RepID=A0AAV7DTL6_ARIFI|nr:hypothetical protein H6P81_019555 [Aristolochia fimbriata]